MLKRTNPRDFDGVASMNELFRPDDATITHECLHAVAAVVEGFPLLIVSAEREDEWLGVTLTLAPDAAAHEARARIVLAPAALGYDGTRDDRREAQLRCAMARGGPSWIADREREVRDLFARPDVRRSVRALAFAVSRAPDGKLNGVAAERIIRGCLRP